MRNHYVIHDGEAIVKGQTVRHETIDLIRYLELNANKRKTYRVLGEVKTIRYIDKLLDIDNHRESA